MPERYESIGSLMVEEDDGTSYTSLSGCRDCGAAVVNEAAHDAFHARFLGPEDPIPSEMLRAHFGQFHRRGLDCG